MLYDSISKRISVVSTPGNIITFKKEQIAPNGERFTQILIQKVERNKGGIKLIGFSRDTDWFNDIKDLLEVVDWKWMAKMHK